jgi:hypothetical protein
MVLTNRPFITPKLLASNGEVSVQNATQERLNQLCQQAAVEKDPEKFLEIIREINDMLEAKRAKLVA